MPNEENEFWRSVHAHNRLARRKRREAQYQPLLDLAEEGYDVQVVNDEGYQFRINKTIDIYPTNKRYHNIKTQQRGHYGDLQDFIHSQLPSCNPTPPLQNS